MKMSKPDPILDDVMRLAATAAKVARERVHADDTLAHLGIDSLGRMRLVGQLEERFGVALGEKAAQGAVTPGGLARAIREDWRKAQKSYSIEEARKKLL